MRETLDLFDPNNWSAWEEPHECRVYGDDRASVWAVVDEADYRWAVRFLWNPKPSHGTVYLKRNVGTARVPIYLHVAIMQQAGPPPSSAHRKVDHRNGDTLDCRRKNLRWATDQMNRRNVKGCAPGE